MGEAIDLTGQRFGRLMVLKKVPKPEGLKNTNAHWLCKCDCGSEPKIINGKSLRRGITKSCRCRMKNGKLWKNGTKMDSRGYILLRKPEHPNADKSKYVPEHVYVMSEHIGRPLRKGEQIHHRNGIRDDNSIDNLELCTRNTHHSGQKVSDLIDFCEDFLFQYDKKSLSEKCIERFIENGKN